MQRPGNRLFQAMGTARVKMLGQILVVLGVFSRKCRVVDESERQSLRHSLGRAIIKMWGFLYSKTP